MKIYIIFLILFVIFNESIAYNKTLSLHEYNISLHNSYKIPFIIKIWVFTEFLNVLII
jgi:hypothetical protein